MRAVLQHGLGAVISTRSPRGHRLWCAAADRSATSLGGISMTSVRASPRETISRADACSP